MLDRQAAPFHVFTIACVAGLPVNRRRWEAERAGVEQLISIRPARRTFTIEMGAPAAKISMRFESGGARWAITARVRGSGFFYGSRN